MNRIAWVYQDCLHRAAYPDVPALFVFDPVFTQTVSLKRIVFLYESLRELGIEVYKGDTTAIVSAFAELHAATEIVTVASPDPRWKSVVATLERTCSVNVLQPEPFVSVQGRLDLKRFSRYWQKVEAAAMRLD